MSYNCIVVAVELNVANDRLLMDKLSAVAHAGSKIYWVHAVEQLSTYGAAYGVSAGLDIEQSMMKEARTILAKLASEYDIASKHLIIEAGSPKQVVLHHAHALSADLIITGSHGRHGVRLLLGSTANAILHGAHCDVLSVRVTE